MAIRKTIAAVGKDEYGFNEMVQVATFELINEKINLNNAITRAAWQYCQTEEGEQYVEKKGDCFTFYDAVTVMPPKFFWENGIALVQLITIPQTGVILDLSDDITLADNTTLENTITKPNAFAEFAA